MKHAPIHWPALRGGLCDLGLGEPEISWISLGELATVRGWPGGSSFIDPALGRRKTPKGTAAAVSATRANHSVSPGSFQSRQVEYG